MSHITISVQSLTSCLLSAILFTGASDSLRAQTKPISSHQSGLASSLKTSGTGQPPKPKRVSQFQLPKLPKPAGAPKGRVHGGGVRGPNGENCENPGRFNRTLCPQGQMLTALVPKNEQEWVMGLTHNEQPTFWFFIPATLKATASIEFVLQDLTDKEVYNTTLTAPGAEAGVISITLPPSTEPLEVNKVYVWTLFVSPDADSPYQSFVNGSVVRVAKTPRLQQHLNTATSLEQFSLYAEQGIWHDAMTTLAQLRRTDPDNSTLTSAWVNLLKQGGEHLDELVTAPISQCCSSLPQASPTPQ